MEAIVLAAGEGSRLRPLTASRPKPMVEAANRPILQYVIESLVESGVKDVTLVVGYHRERVQAYFEDGRKFGARIEYVFQSALLGTAHALSLCEIPKEPFLVLGGDNVIDAGLLREVMRADGEVVLAAKRSENPSKYGVLHLEGTRVKGIEEQPPGHVSEFVNTGVYRFPGNFESRFRPLVDEGRMGMSHALNGLMAEGGEVHAVPAQGLWADAVYPWDLLALNAYLLAQAPPPESAGPRANPGVNLQKPVVLGPDAEVGPHSVVSASSCIGANVTVGPGAVIENSIIHEDAQIGPGAIIQNSIIGHGARIGSRFTAIAGDCTARTVDGFHDLKDFGCVIGEDARIGGGVTLSPGVLVGNRARIPHGKQVCVNVEDEAKVV